MITIDNMLLSLDIFVKFFFWNHASFININLSHNIFSDKLIILCCKDFLNASNANIFNMACFLWRNRSIIIFLEWFILYYITITFLFTFSPLSLFSLLQFFFFRILIPRKKILFDHTTDHLLRLFINPKLLIFELILCDFRIILFPLIPQLLKCYLFFWTIHFILSILYHLIYLGWLYFIIITIYIILKPHLLPRLLNNSRLSF